MPIKLSEQKKDISGDPYKGTTLLRPLELKVINFLAPRVPSFIETYHLTLSSLFFSVLMIVAAFLAKNNLNWFWVIIASLVIQFFADALDGEIGRRRNTGLINWGFYTDHFLDFIFMSAVFISHAIIWSADAIIFMGLLVIFGGSFMHEALSCVCLGEYNVRGYRQIGGTEVRAFLILIDVYILFFRPQAVGIIFLVLLPIFLIMLFRQAYEKQKVLWALDMKNRKGV